MEANIGSIGGLLGLSGGAGGTGFAGPTTNDIVGKGQLDQANQTAQQALTQQQAFAQAVQPAGLQALQSQQQLLGQLQAGAQGQGPNPALAQLNQTTGQNVANQAALMAGQRGSNQNAGLIARQAAQQGAATQQQAAGQAATMSAQQQIAYMQQLQAQQAQLVGQQAQATGAQTQAAQNQQLGLTNAASGLQQNVNQSNAALAGTQLQGQQGLIGGLANAAGPALKGLFAEGGKISEPLIINAADGGQLPTIPTTSPQSSFAQYLNGINYGNPGANALAKGIGNLGQVFDSSDKTKTPTPAPVDSGTGGMASAANNFNSNTAGSMADYAGSANSFKDGGKVPALVSPGEIFLKPKEVEKVKKGANPMKIGEKIPGKPKVPGAKNSYANDTVPKNLDEGGIVIPRSVTQDPNPYWESMKFVHETLRQGKK